MGNGKDGPHTPPDPDESLWEDRMPEDSVWDATSKPRKVEDVPQLKVVSDEDELRERRQRRIDLDSARELVRQEFGEEIRILKKVVRHFARKSEEETVGLRAEVRTALQEDRVDLEGRMVVSLEEQSRKIGNSVAKANLEMKRSIPKPVSKSTKAALVAALVALMAGIGLLSYWHVQTTSRVVAVESTMGNVVAETRAIVEPFEGMASTVEQNSTYVADLRTRQSLDDDFRQEAGAQLSALQLDFDLHKEDEMSWRDVVGRAIGRHKRELKRTRETTSALTSVTLHRGSGGMNEAMWNRRADSSQCPNPDPGSDVERQVLLRSHRENGGKPVRACFDGFNGMQYFLYCDSMAPRRSLTAGESRFKGCHPAGNYPGS